MPAATTNATLYPCTVAASADCAAPDPRAERVAAAATVTSTASPRRRRRAFPGCPPDEHRAARARRAVPTTALAVVTELFRGWAGPLHEPALDVVDWYFTEVPEHTDQVGLTRPHACRWLAAADLLGVGAANAPARWSGRAHRRGEVGGLVRHGVRGVARPAASSATVGAGNLRLVICRVVQIWLLSPPSPPRRLAPGPVLIAVRFG